MQGHGLWDATFHLATYLKRAKSKIAGGRFYAQIGAHFLQHLRERRAVKENAFHLCRNHRGYERPTIANCPLPSKAYIH
jgi:hypothetical protein